MCMWAVILRTSTTRERFYPLLITLPNGMAVIGRRLAQTAQAMVRSMGLSGLLLSVGRMYMWAATLRASTTMGYSYALLIMLLDGMAAVGRRLVRTVQAVVHSTALYIR